MSSRVGFLVVLRNTGHRKGHSGNKTCDHSWEECSVGLPHHTAVETDYDSNGAEPHMSGRHASEDAWTSAESALTLIYINI